MILAIYLAVTTLLATFLTVTVPHDAFFTYVRLIGPSDGIPTRTLSSPVLSVVDSVPSLLSDHARRVAEKAPYQYGALSLYHIIGFAPSASIASDASETVKLVEPCSALSPTALVCILFVTVVFIVFARFVSLSTRLLEYDSTTEIHASSPASVDEYGHPFEEERMPIGFERLIDDISDRDAMDVWSWKVSKGHLTVFYTPDAPYADEEAGFEVKIGGAYKFQVMRDFSDDESVVESELVCDCGNTTTTAPTTADVTSSSSADMVATLPSAMASPDIPALLAFIKRSEDELRNLLSTLPISVLDESILDPRDCNISSMTNDVPEHQDVSVAQP